MRCRGWRRFLQAQNQAINHLNEINVAFALLRFNANTCSTWTGWPRWSGLFDVEQQGTFLGEHNSIREMLMHTSMSRLSIRTSNKYDRAFTGFAPCGFQRPESPMWIPASKNNDD